MVSEQICTNDRKMDQRAWQKIISFDLLHSSYMCLQTIFSRGKHCKTMQIGSVSRLRFCRRSLRIQILHQVEHCAFSEVTRLFPISWMCKKQPSVSHSSTESEIILLDAGFRMDGTPALDSWGLIVTVLHGNTHQNDQVWGDPYMTS